MIDEGGGTESRHGIVYIAEDEVAVVRSGPDDLLQAQPAFAPPPGVVGGWVVYGPSGQTTEWAPNGRFRARWESERHGRPVLMEEGPEFDSAEEAIAWGRRRAPVVLIRIGPPPRTYYSAGESDPAGESLPRWDSRTGRP